MYALKHKPRYLIKNMLDDLYNWATETWEKSGYAEWSSGCGWGSPEEYPEITNYNELDKDIHYGIVGDKWTEGELQGDFENEIRSCVASLTDKDAERIIKWMGLSIDNSWYDYPRDGLEDSEEFAKAITSKFIYRKLNINED